MKIGIAGPMTLELLDFNFKNESNIPVGYDSPMISMLINALLKCGHEVVAYTTSTGISQPVVYEGKNLTTCIARRRECHAARDLFKSECKDLVELMRSYPVNVINAQWSYEFAWAAIDSGIPTLVTLRDHALAILKYHFDGYRFMRLIMNHIVLRRARYLSTNSQYLFDLLSKKNRKKACIIPNFYSKALEEHSSTPARKSNFILSVSNGFSRCKNIQTGLRTFSIIKQKYPDLEYHLLGDDMGLGGAAHVYARKNKLTDGVRFIGKLPFNQVIRKIRKALVFLHPSREESFGMSVLESMVIGTPVVAGYRSGNIPYLLDNGRAGILCDVNSPEDVANAVLKLLTNSEFAQFLTTNARKFARDNFSQEKVIQDYLNYYETIISSART